MNDDLEPDEELDDLEEPDAGDDEAEAGSAWDGGPFLAGLVVGAAVGAGLALLFAPAPGRTTRRRVRRKVEALERDVSERLEGAAKVARKELSDRRAELRERIERGVERLEELGR